MSDDQLLTELTELLTNADGTIDDTPVDPNKSLDMVLEEMDDPGRFAQRQSIVEKDLLKYADNPRLPTPTERMNMLDRVDNGLWYDKWQAERCAQVADAQGVEMQLVRTRIFNPSLEASKKTVQEAFGFIEEVQDKKPVAFETLEQFAERQRGMDWEDYDEKMDTIELGERLPTAKPEVPKPVDGIPLEGPELGKFKFSELRTFQRYSIYGGLWHFWFCCWYLT